MTPPKATESRLLACADCAAEVPALELGHADDEKHSLLEWLRSRFGGGAAP